VPRNVHVNNVSMEEKDKFKKRSPRYLWMRKQQQEKQQQESFTIISIDESFFFYDSLIRRV
jgi:hypothetical protein